MADPNQTPPRGDWACPCAGCEKAAAVERKQIIQILKDNNANEELVNLIEARNPVKKVRK